MGRPMKLPTHNDPEKLTISELEKIMNNVEGLSPVERIELKKKAIDSGLVDPASVIGGHVAYNHDTELRQAIKNKVITIRSGIEGKVRAQYNESSIDYVRDSVGESNDIRCVGSQLSNEVRRTNGLDSKPDEATEEFHSAMSKYVMTEEEFLNQIRSYGQ